MEYICGICEKKFDYSYSLVRHLNTIHSSKTYQCPHCIFACNRKDNLVYHIKRIHGKDEIDTTEYSYGCDVCGQLFKTSSALKHHQDSRHSGNVHRCHVCIRSFSTKKGLTKHLKKTNHDNLNYEKRLLEGKKLLEFMVEELVPVDVMPSEDMELIHLYRRYTYQKVDTFSDVNVPL